MKISKKHTISALVALVIATLFLVLWKDEPKKQFYHNEGSVFGTYYNIRYEASKDLKDSVVASFAAFDKSLSMFNPHSTLSAINANRDTVTDAAFEAGTCFIGRSVRHHGSAVGEGVRIWQKE